MEWRQEKAYTDRIRSMSFEELVSEISRIHRIIVKKGANSKTSRFILLLQEEDTTNRDGLAFVEAMRVTAKEENQA